MIHLRTSVVAVVSVAALTASCQQPQEPAAANDLAAANKMATADEFAPRGTMPGLVHVFDASGKDIGRVLIEEDPNGVTLTLWVEDLPEGTHGVHLHEKGICEPPFQSAGAHWNPISRQHGRNNANGNGAHLGDLDNIDATAGSGLKKIFTIPDVSYGDKKENRLKDADGTSLVIHADKDDYETDPDGKSGERIACAVLAK